MMPLTLTAAPFSKSYRKSECVRQCCAANTKACHMSCMQNRRLTHAPVSTRYDRSYDVTLVRREYMGRSIVAMNIMWAYAEQKSFQVRVVCWPGKAGSGCTLELPQHDA